MSSISTKSTPRSLSRFLVRLAYSTAAEAEKILLLVGANPIFITTIYPPIISALIILNAVLNYNK